MIFLIVAVRANVMFAFECSTDLFHISIKNELAMSGLSGNFF